MQKKGLIGLIIIAAILVLAIIGFFTVKQFTGQVISEKQECIQSCIDEGCSDNADYIDCTIEIGENCKSKCIDSPETNLAETENEQNQTEEIIIEEITEEP